MAVSAIQMETYTRRVCDGLREDAGSLNTPMATFTRVREKQHVPRIWRHVMGLFGG